MHPPDTILLDDLLLPITVEADDDDLLEVVSDALGPKGDPGADGRDGVDGRDGLPGAPGTDGRDGTDGVDGQDGTDGRDGADGRDGVDGLPGEPGAPGVDGRDGVDGLPGRDGVDGADGTDGLPGTPGLPGADGQDGTNGQDGADGRDGVDGLPGAPGADGRDGTDGRDGVDGQDGTDGAPGLKGDPGSPGLPFALVATGSVNLIVAEGRYAVSSAQGTTANGYPSGGAGTLEVAVDAAGSIYQTHQITSSPGVTLVFRRQRTPAGTWFIWREWQASRFDATAGRAQYTWDRSNNREQLTYGDTGWRDISSLLANGFRGTLHICREGGQTSLTGQISCPTGTTTMNGIFLDPVPAGFTAKSSPWVFYPVRSNAGATLFTLYRKGSQLVFENSPVIAESNVTRFEISWRTTDTWPTALPGTADGAIPNL